MVSYLVLRLRLESGLGSTTQETLAWDCASGSVSGGSSCQGRRVKSQGGLCLGRGHRARCPFHLPGHAGSSTLRVQEALFFTAIEPAPGCVWGGSGGKGYLWVSARVTCPRDFSELLSERSLPLLEHHALSPHLLTVGGRDKGLGNSMPRGPSGGARELTQAKTTAGTPDLERGGHTEQQGLQHRQGWQASSSGGRRPHRQRGGSRHFGKTDRQTAGDVKTLTPGLIDGSGR